VSEIEVLPRELMAAAEPLRRAAEALDDVANSRRSLTGLIEASPSARLVEAFRSFLAAWELVVWCASEDAAGFGGQVEQAAWYYGARENALARGMPETLPWANMPPLRDPVVSVAAPHPQAAPAPLPSS
jgi:hypothetical protein